MDIAVPTLMPFTRFGLSVWRSLGTLHELFLTCIASSWSCDWPSLQSKSWLLLLRHFVLANLFPDYTLSWLQYENAFWESSETRLSSQAWQVVANDVGQFDERMLGTRSQDDHRSNPTLILSKMRSFSGKMRMALCLPELQRSEQRSARSARRRDKNRQVPIAWMLTREYLFLQTRMLKDFMPM